MTKQHWRTLAFLVALIAPPLLLGGWLLFESRAPQLVSLALPLGDQEILLSVGPIDRAPVWQVYGLDGRPRRRWGAQPLPAGYLKRADGFLERDVDAVVPAENVPPFDHGEPFQDLTTRSHIELSEPPGMLTRRHLDAAEQALERVDLDGKLRWSMRFAELLGPTRLAIQSTEVRSAMTRSNGQLLLVVQAIQPGLSQPVSATVVRLVSLDATTGRVVSRTDVAPALLARD